MRRRSQDKVFSPALCVGLAVLGLCVSITAGAAKLDREEQRYIIRFSHGQAENARRAVEQNNGKRIRKLKRRDLIAADLSDKDRDILSRNPHVVSLEIDPRRYPTVQELPYGVAMVQSPLLAPGWSPVKVCIVDTGYDLGHPDLPDSTRVNGEALPGTGVWDNDGYGHGTHVAGTIAAIDNAVGVMGVHPGPALTLHIVKVFDDSGRWTYGSDLIDALDDCVAAGAQVVSMSLGGTGSSASESNAFAEALAAGVLPVAAAGNAGNTRLSFPASYDSVISVAAVDGSKNLASFSQRNGQVELAAPGVAVKSTLPGGNYASWSGTSMATPHVSAAAALLWSNHPDCTAVQIRQALAATAQDLGTAGRDTSYGFGLVQVLDADAAIVAQGCDVVPGEPPESSVTALGNGQLLTGLAGDSGLQAYYSIDLPEGATNLAVQLSGGSGDVDLYVRRGNLPDTGNYDCLSSLSGNNETCAIGAPQTPSTYYFMLYGRSAFAGASLAVNYSDKPPPVNKPPVAAITAAPITGRAPLLVSFDSSLSTDDSGIVARNWLFAGADIEQVSGPTAPAATYRVPGTYTATLSVADEGGLEDTAELAITVLPPNRNPSSAFSVSPGSGITTNTRVTFDASDSSDPDGDSLTYTWVFGDGGTASGVNVTRFFAAGYNSVELHVDDGFGGTSTRSRQIAIAPAPAPTSNIDLAVSLNRIGTKARLRWSGASTTWIEVFRNGNHIKRTLNDGLWRDKSLLDGGRYRICEDQSSNCSAEVGL